METGEALTEWKDVGGAVQQIRWLDDGKSLLLSLYSNRSNPLRSKAIANALVSSGGFMRRSYPDGQQLWKAMPHDDEIGQVVFAPDGKQMLSSGRDGQVFLWNMETGDNRLVDIALPRFPTGHLEFSPNGQLVLVRWGREARIYRLPSLELVGALDVPGWKQVLFSPDSKAVMDGQTRQQVLPEQVYALKGQPLQVGNPINPAQDAALDGADLMLPDKAKPYLRRQLEGWRTLAIAPTGNFIAGLPLNASDPYIYLWDAALTRITRRFRHPLTSVESLEMAPAGKTLWMRGNLEYDDRQSRQRVAELNLDSGETRLLAGYPRPTRFTPQTTTAVSPDYKRLVYVVAERRPEAATKVKERRPLTSADYAFEVRIVDVQSGNLLWKWPDAPLHDAVAVALGPLRNGQNDCVVLRARAAEEGAAKYDLTAYSIKTAPLPANLPISAAPEGPAKLWQLNEVQWPQEVSSPLLSISPDGQWLVTFGGLRETATGQLRYTLPPSHVALWSANSQTLALSDGTHVQWLNVQTGKVQIDIPAVGSLLSLSMDGSSLATLSANMSLLWGARPQILPNTNY